MLFWVDALCIDQSSLEERAAGVSIMGNIYARKKGYVLSLEMQPMKKMSPFLGLHVEELLEVAAKLRLCVTKLHGTEAVAYSTCCKSADIGGIIFMLESNMHYSKSCACKEIDALLGKSHIGVKNLSSGDPR
jgi:hypothetical protein